MPFLGLVEAGEQVALEVITVLPRLASPQPGDHLCDHAHHGLLIGMLQDLARMLPRERNKWLPRFDRQCSPMDRSATGDLPAARPHAACRWWLRSPLASGQLRPPCRRPSAPRPRTA